MKLALNFDFNPRLIRLHSPSIFQGTNGWHMERQVLLGQQLVRALYIMEFQRWISESDTDVVISLCQFNFSFGFVFYVNFIYLFNKIVSSAWPSTLLHRSILWLILICPVSIYTCFALISIHILLICISPFLCFLKCRNLALGCTSSTDLNGLSLIMRALHILIFQFLYMTLLVCHWLFNSLRVWPGLGWSVEFII